MKWGQGHNYNVRGQTEENNFIGVISHLNNYIFWAATIALSRSMEGWSPSLSSSRRCWGGCGGTYLVLGAGGRAGGSVFLWRAGLALPLAI